MNISFTNSGIEITWIGKIADFINFFTGEYCTYCHRKNVPMGMYQQLECPNRCAWKEFEKKHIKKVLK